MEHWTVTEITEADFGCEECGPEGPKALVFMKNDAGEIRQKEIPEKVLAETGIKEGKMLLLLPDGSVRKFVRVVAAVIRKDNMVFATQRGYGAYKDGWEFPGGKIEPGETSEQALIREIREELDTEITVGQLIRTIEYDYPEFHLSMDCFRCTLAGGAPVLKEHEAAKWLDRASLGSVDWLPADLTLMEEILAELGAPKH